VIPMALRGMWGSFFSRRYGAAMQRPPRRFWSRITLVASAPVSADKVSAGDLQQQVLLLRGSER